MKEIMAIIDRMEAFAASSDDGYAINGWADELRTLLAALLSSDRAVQPDDGARETPDLNWERLQDIRGRSSAARKVDVLWLVAIVEEAWTMLATRQTVASLHQKDE